MLGTTTFTPEHVCGILFRLLNIFEKLWHEERIALDREEEKKQKRSQNNFLESHVWSQNIWKTCGEKNLKFFESRLEFLYFDMLKNEDRGSNRLGVKKSFVTQIVRYRSKTIKLKNVVFELNYCNKKMYTMHCGRI